MRGSSCSCATFQLARRDKWDSAVAEERNGQLLQSYTEQLKRPQGFALFFKNAERRSSLVTVSGDVQTTRFGHMSQKLVESATVLTSDDRRPLVLSDSDIFRECTRQTKKIGRKCNGRRCGIWPGRVQVSQSHKIDAAMPFVCAWKIWRSM